MMWANLRCVEMLVSSILSPDAQKFKLKFDECKDVIKNKFEESGM